MLSLKFKVNFDETYELKIIYNFSSVDENAFKGNRLKFKTLNEYYEMYVSLVKGLVVKPLHSQFPLRRRIPVMPISKPMFIFFFFFFG